MQTRYALLVIDMQLVAFDGEITPPINDGAEVIENAAYAIRLRRAAQVPIVYVQTKAISGQPYAQDTHGWEIHPALLPHPTDLIVYKRNSSGFDGTTFHRMSISPPKARRC